MSRLSHEQWLEITPPFFWIKTDFLQGKDEIYRQMVYKWLDESISGWWYNSGEVYVFSTAEDRAAFKLWMLTDAFSNTYGDIDLEN